MVDAYLAYARGYYVDLEGNPSSGLEPVEAAAAMLKGVYGDAPAAEFGPVALRGLRHAMIGRDLCRATVNQRVGVVKRIFRWAVADERVPPAVYQALACVEPLRRGRSGARETPPVRPVPDAHVDAVLPYLPPTVAAMVQVQRLTGMRSGEVCRLRPSDLDRSGTIWIYRPPVHKTSYRGHPRTVRIGPRAQDVLKPFLDATPADAYIFSPRRAIRERARGQVGLGGPEPVVRVLPDARGGLTDGRRVGERYVPRSYQRAVRYAILAAERAGALAAGCRWHPQPHDPATLAAIRRLLCEAAGRHLLVKVSEGVRTKDVRRAAVFRLHSHFPRHLLAWVADPAPMYVDHVWVTVVPSFDEILGDLLDHLVDPGEPEHADNVIPSAGFPGVSAWPRSETPVSLGPMSTDNSGPVDQAASSSEIASNHLYPPDNKAARGRPTNSSVGHLWEQQFSTRHPDRQEKWGKTGCRPWEHCAHKK